MRLRVNPACAGSLRQLYRYACNMPVIKAFTRHRISLRNHHAEVLTWGDPASMPVLMLPGWMDVAASFQFLVDAMKNDWYVIAPEQRGYGGTDCTKEGASGYWFADYVADLEALFDHFSPDEATNLVDHSLVTWVPRAHVRLWQ